jgi:DNA-binding protein H-NS
MPISTNLDNMSIDALIELRETVTETLKRRVAELHRELSGQNDTGGRKDGQSHDGIDSGPRRREGERAGRTPPVKRRKIEAKYRSQKDPTLTWTGRGLAPHWLREEMADGKVGKEAFLIAQQ